MIAFFAFLALKHPLIFYFRLLGECFDRRDSRAFTAFVPEKSAGISE